MCSVFNLFKFPKEDITNNTHPKCDGVGRPIDNRYIVNVAVYNPNVISEARILHCSSPLAIHNS